MGLFEEKFKLFFHPSYHFRVLVQNSAFTEQEWKYGVFVHERIIWESLIDRFESLFKHLLQLDFRVSLICQQIVEQNKGRMIDHFWIAASKAVVAEVDQSFASLQVLHQGASLICGKDIG